MNDKFTYSNLLKLYGTQEKCLEAITSEFAEDLEYMAQKMNESRTRHRKVPYEMKEMLNYATREIADYISSNYKEKKKFTTKEILDKAQTAMRSLNKDLF